jgi:molybdate transport system ATP-binding protein
MRPNDGGQCLNSLAGNTAIVSFEAAAALLQKERYNDDSDFVEGGVAEGTTVRAFLAATLSSREALQYPGGAGLEAHPAVRDCGVAEFLDRGLKRLSTGECRRALLCRAVLSRPGLVVVVDPYEGLDTATRASLHSMLEAMVGEAVRREMHVRGDAAVRSDTGVPAVVIVDRLDHVPAAVNRVVAFADGAVRYAGPRDAYEARLGMQAGSTRHVYREGFGLTSKVADSLGDDFFGGSSIAGNILAGHTPADHLVTPPDQDLIPVGSTGTWAGTVAGLAKEEPWSESGLESESESGSESGSESESESELAPLIELRDVTVAWSGRAVLDRISWTVRPGEHWLVRGPNGSGKTTLLELITGDNPQAYCNDVRVFGQRRGGGQTIWELKSRIGIVSYRLHLEYRYLDGLALEDVILSGLYDSIGLYTTVSEGERTLARSWLELAGFAGRGGQQFGQLSFGEQRALLVARAAIKLPELLILDEPCHGLDESQRSFVLSLLAAIARCGQSTMIHVTHDLEEVQSFETKVLDLLPGQSPMWVVSGRQG